MLSLFNENSTNITDDIFQSDSYFNSSEKLESLTQYPAKLAKFYFKFFYKGRYNKFNLIKKVFFDYTIGWLFNKSLFLSFQFIGILITLILYGLFYFSLLNQKE